MTPSKHFAEWLWNKRINIALRLQNKRVMLISADAAGLVVSDDEYISTSEAEPQPRDLFSGGDGTDLFVSARYSCIAKSGDGPEICPVWKPFFISEVKSEDRCHLNGMAVRDGKPAYATAFAETDVKGGWRQKIDDGVVIDVESNAIACRGLFMPHSPRWHDGKLWVLNSGTGELGIVEAEHFHPVARCFGFARGLSFFDDYALVGSSPVRGNPFFRGVSGLDQTSQLCGVHVLNLQTAEVEHSLHFNGPWIGMYELTITNKTGDETTMQHKQSNPAR